MNSTETITLEILAKDLASGNIRTFVGHVDEAAKRGGIMGSVFQGVGQSVGRSITSMINPTMLLSGVLDQAGDAAMHLATGVITQAIQGEVVTARLTKALENNDKAWHGNMEAIDAASEAAANYGFVNDDVENSIATSIVATKNLAKSIQIVAVAEDLARAKNITLEEATKILTKAYNGSTTALTRMGIKVDKTHKGLQTVADVEKVVAGNADKMSHTFTGKLTTMGAKVENFQEEVGTKLMPQLEGWAGTLIDMFTDASHSLDFLSGKAQANPNYTQLGPYDVVPRGYNSGSTRGDRGRYSRRHHHAAGGVIGAGDWGIVGENGPEMIYNAGGGGIGVIPNGSGVHVHFHTAYPPSPQEGERIAQALAPHLRREMARIGT